LVNALLYPLNSLFLYDNDSLFYHRSDLRDNNIFFKRKKIKHILVFYIFLLFIFFISDILMIIHARDFLKSFKTFFLTYHELIWIGSI
jgi:hypothetical protein